MVLSYMEQTLAVPLKLNTTQEFSGLSKIIEIRYSNWYLDANVYIYSSNIYND